MQLCHDWKQYKPKKKTFPIFFLAFTCLQSKYYYKINNWQTNLSLSFTLNTLSHRHFNINIPCFLIFSNTCGQRTENEYFIFKKIQNLKYSQVWMQQVFIQTKMVQRRREVRESYGLSCSSLFFFIGLLCSSSAELTDKGVNYEGNIIWSSTHILRLWIFFLPKTCFFCFPFSSCSNRNQELTDWSSWSSNELGWHSSWSL